MFFTFLKNALYSNSLYFLHHRKTFFILILQKIFLSFTTMLAFFFFFFFRKVSISLTSILTLFVFFLLQKDFNIFHVLLLEAFLCVFDNIYLPFLYIEKILFYTLFICFKNLTLPYGLCK